VKLANDCKFVKIILERPSEKETIAEINLEDLPLGACPRTNIFKLEPRYTLSNSRLLYCMWYEKT